MSFFNSFRRAFGIGDEYEDDYQDLDSEEQEEVAPEPSQPNGQIPTSNVSDGDRTYIDQDLAADLLDSVVALFNSTQPDFVKSCINTDEQKKQLYNSLDKTIKERINDAITRGHQAGQNQWNGEQRKLSEELEKLRLERSELNQKREESKGALLSAERQKRALTERVRDLESQTAKMLSENEQLVLENRSLMNKLRVAGVLAGNSSNLDMAAQLTSELNKVQEEFEAFKKVTEEEKSELKAQLTKLQDDYKLQSAFLEKAKSFSTNSSEKDEKISSQEKEIERLKVELSTASNKSDNLINELSVRNTRIKELEEDLTTASYIKDQVDKIELSLKKKEEQIETSKTEKKELKKTIAELQDALLKEKADSEKLKGEIATLKEDIEKKQQTIAELTVIEKEKSVTEADGNQEQKEIPESLPTPKKRSRQPKKRNVSFSADTETSRTAKEEENQKTAPIISAIDDLLDCNDWFVAPDASEFVKEPSEPEDFGYKPPQRKTNEIIDDNQLSLW